MVLTQEHHRGIFSVRSDLGYDVVSAGVESLGGTLSNSGEACRPPELLLVLTQEYHRGIFSARSDLGYDVVSAGVEALGFFRHE